MSNDERGPEDRRDEFAPAAAGGRADQRLVEELRERVERAEQNAQRERQLRERERQLRERERQLRNVNTAADGTYYNRISDVWGTADTPFGAEDDEYLRREFDEAPNPPNLHWTQRNGLRPKYPYALTKEGIVNALNLHLEAVDDVRQSRTSHGTKVKTEIWPYCIFGGKSGEVAHLLPAAPNDALTWHMVAEWVLGLKDGKWPQVKLAINGFKAPSEHSRREGTGIKHFTANKMKLNDQKTFMDNNPCVLIVPIRTVNQAKNWNGKGYDAIVVVDEWEGQEMRDICRCVGMNVDFGPEATREEIGISTDLLSQVVRGMAHRVLARRQNPTRLGELPQQIRDFDGSATTIAFSALNRVPTVKVPVAKEGALKVRKISFNGQATGPGADTNRGHIAPDPLILAAKAACVWSKRQGQSLVAGGEVEDDDFSEGDIIAAEAYIAAQEAYEASLRPRSRQDLARGLHQPNMYQAGV